jgi:hypothetical protein
VKEERSGRKAGGKSGREIARFPLANEGQTTIFSPLSRQERQGYEDNYEDGFDHESAKSRKKTTKATGGRVNGRKGAKRRKNGTQPVDSKPILLATRSFGR